MTSSEFGDIILVPFPFTDQSTTKKRKQLNVKKLSVAYCDMILHMLPRVVTCANG